MYFFILFYILAGARFLENELHGLTRQLTMTFLYLLLNSLFVSPHYCTIGSVLFKPLYVNVCITICMFRYPSSSQVYQFSQR